MEKTEEELELEAFNSVFSAKDEAPAKVEAEEPKSEVAAETPAEPQQEEKQEEAPKTEAKDEADEFAGLPPKVRELLAEIPQLRAVASAVPELRGRVASLQSRLDKQAAKAKDAPQIAETLRQELPDVAKAIEEVHQRMVVEPEPEPAAQSSAPSRDEELLNDFRPTWAQEFVSPDFQLWLTTQSKDYQAEVRATDSAKVVMGALTRWDKSTAARKQATEVNAQRSQRMAAAVQPSGARQAPPVRDEVDDETAGFLSVFRKTR